MASKNLINVTGEKYHMWTAIEYFPILKDKKVVSAWLCKCDCGTIKQVRSCHLKSGASKNCGCVTRKKNGLSGTRLAHTYSDMVRRCYDEKSHGYRWYGERGISVCEEWLNDFMMFYNWAINNGYEDDLTIDRINVNGNYEPSNCKWATSIEQANNKSNNLYVTINGITKSISGWSDETGIKKSTIYSRYFREGKRGNELIIPIRPFKNKKYTERID